MNARHVRLALCYLAAGATGYAIGSACAWLITAASFGAFLTFLVWLCAVLLAYFVGEKLGQALYDALVPVITDARVDSAKRAVAKPFAALRKVFA